MSLDSPGLLAAFKSKLASLGLFDAVVTHEPKGVTGQDSTCAVWIDRMFPTTALTGLNQTAMLIVFNVRLLVNALLEPQDSIEGILLESLDVLYGALNGDFTLTGAVDFVDLLGQAGVPMETRFGYVTLGGTLYRVADLTVPVALGDVWTQEG